jgi:hypothetical protein
MATIDLAPPQERLNPPPQPSPPYARSYLLIRMSVGLMGIVLPFALILGEYFFVRGDVDVRGSLSSYYHSPMSDLFVATLSITGFLLIMYRIGEYRKPGFWFSLAAGVAVLGVVFFPTWRPGLSRDAARCGDTPEPPGCSSVQQFLHEGPTAVIHFTCAVVFILCLAVIAGLFARESRELAKDDRRLARDATVQWTCMVLILAAVGWVALGQVADLTIWKITPLYAGEVGAVWAFGVSWLLASRSYEGRSDRK